MDESEPALITHLRRAQENERFSFHMPGHKGGNGAPAAAVDLLGSAAFAADLSEIGGFDYLHGARSALVDAQAEAAALLGASRTWFLVNGASVGNIAAICATINDGGELLVARGSHRSVYAGIVLSGARPTYLPPVANPELDGLFGLDPNDLEAALQRNRQIRAVHVTSPSAYGFTVPLAEIAELTRAYDVPLIVDEAHGTHFALHPDFPDSALSCGADVVVHSPHKSLGALTQSALLHHQGDLIDPAILDRMLPMLQSSSPSALLTVSLAAAVHEMAAHGRSRWDAALELARGLRREIARRPPLAVLDREVIGAPGIAGLDTTKLVVDVHELEVTGYAAARHLRDRHGINPEAADLRRIVFAVTIGDTAESTAVLLDALEELVASPPGRTGPGRVISAWPATIPEASETPRDTSHARNERVPIAEAVGRSSAEMIVPYPPGVPLLVAGELISAEIVEAIVQLLEAGCHLVGMSDARGETLCCLQRPEVPHPPRPRPGGARAARRAVDAEQWGG